MNTPHTEWTAQEIMHMSGAYWAGCAVQAAVQLDMFTALGDRRMELDDLAARTGCDPRALGMLATALAALGFLARDGNTLGATASARRYLSKDSPEYAGFIILHHASLIPLWAQLADAVRTGKPARAGSASHIGSEEEREAFLMGMFNVAVQQAGTIAAAIDLSGRKRLLDLGGGPGTYAVHFCLANPRLSAIVYDMPTTRRFADDVVRRHKMSGRIDFIGGDFLRDDIPGGCDVVWISQILHGESPEDAAMLVGKAACSLAVGGVMYIQDFVLDDSRSGPAHPALFSLNMLVGTRGGQSYTDGELRAMMRDAGLTDIRRIDIPLPSGCAIIAGTKKEASC